MTQGTINTSERQAELYKQDAQSALDILIADHIKAFMEMNPHGVDMLEAITPTKLGPR
ncbi:Uncharacterised protein [uncultured archaeon]|nr:Uncharacterised protein [uncultured archaeon]